MSTVYQGEQLEIIQKSPNMWTPTTISVGEFCLCQGKLVYKIESGGFVVMESGKILYPHPTDAVFARIPKVQIKVEV